MDDQTSVASVACKSKVPPFIETDPNLWFLQLSSHFIAERITSQKAKFHAAVSALPRSTLYQIASLLRTQGETPYDDLQTRLQRIYGVTADQRIQALLDGVPDCEQRPSHILNMIRYHLSETTPGDVIKALWMKQLTPDIRRALVTSTLSDLDGLASIADRLNEVRDDAVHSIDHTDPSLRQQLDRLTAAIERLNRPRERSRSRESPRARSPGRRQDNNNTRHRSPTPSTCYYHRRWGRDARKCSPPCSMAQGNASRRPSA